MPHTVITAIKKIDATSRLQLPITENGISAGFPSPADDFIDLSIDLNKTFIQHPNATFFGRVSGDSMINAGLSDGDYLIIDRSLEPKHKQIAVCLINGDFTVKRLHILKENVYLVPENEAYQPIEVTPEDDFNIWGVVTTVIKPLQVSCLR